MELFEFKRYIGDDGGEISYKPKTSSRLDDYLQRVKERKRAREEVSCGDEIQTVTDEVSEQNDNISIEHSYKKKKKESGNKSSDFCLKDYLERVKARKKAREDINDLKNECDLNISVISKVDRSDESVEKLEQCELSSNADHEVTRKKQGEQSDVSTIPEFITLSCHQQSTDADLHSLSTIDKPRKKKKKKKGKVVKTDNEIVSNEVGVPETKNVESNKKDIPVVSFQVLGAHSFKDKVKVKRVLPRWLAEPTVISAALSSNRHLKDVGPLHRTFIHNLESMGVNELFPVQLAVIPHQLQSYKKIHYLWPRDLCVSAPTGSGKTLAYVLPLLQAHFSFHKSALFALVVVPVQELAIQVAKVFRDVSKGSGIKIGCVTGGTDRESQAKTLVFKREDGTYVNLVHILVATPGRLMEHFFLTPGFNVKSLKFIVIDEADRVVEQKSLNWLHLIEKQCNPYFNGTQPPVTFHNLKTCHRGPQKLLFSATLSQDPEKLLKLNLFQPKLITSVSESEMCDENKDNFYGKFTTPSTLSEKYVVCDIDKKPLLVHKYLEDGWRRVLIFTKSCVEANRLYELLKILNKNINMAELTSLMILGKRQLAVNDFSRGAVDVLVCSDRMARGMDIADVNYVIIYDPPKYAKGYIHKAGRTGRAGKSGTSITIVSQKQSQGFLQMLKKAGKTDLELLSFNESDLEDFMPAYEEALVLFKSVVNTQNNFKLNNMIKEKRTKTIVRSKNKKRTN